MSSTANTDPCASFKKLLSTLKASNSSKYKECMRNLVIHRCYSAICMTGKGMEDKFLKDNIQRAINLIDMICMPPPAAKKRAAGAKGTAKETPQEPPSKKRVSFSLEVQLSEDYKALTAKLNREFGLDLPTLMN